MHFLKNPISFPAEFSTILEKYFQNNAAKTTADLEKLWPHLAIARGQSKEDHYSFQKNFAHAYASYYLPVNCLKIATILEELYCFGADLFPAEKKNLRCLDFGAGPGTALWGYSAWTKAHEMSLEYCGVEQSKSFIQVGEELAQKLQQSAAHVRANFQLMQASQRAKDWEKVSSLIEEKQADIISFVNSFAEIASSASEKEIFLKNLIDTALRTARRKKQAVWLILVEPGTKDFSRELIQLRNSVLDNPKVKLWLPCLSARTCGALAGATDWCHEEVACEFPSWLQNLGEKAKLKKESMLFSYLVYSIGDEHPSRSAPWPTEAYRMVSQRLEQKGQTECYFCTTNGKQKRRVQRKNQNETNEIFLQTTRGEIFTSIAAGEKGDVESLEKFTVARPSKLWPV